MKAFNSKQRYEKLATIRFTFSKIHSTWSFNFVVLRMRGMKCTRNKNAHAEPLFFSLNLWFDDVLLGLTVVIC